MDLNQYFSSSIIPRKNDMCFVQFPSFTGYSEVVIYRHEHINLSYGVKELFPNFRCDEVYLDIHRVILASRILSYIGVRIINTDTIYDEEIFLVQSGEIFSFELAGIGYFAFIYRDYDGKEGYHTSIPKDSLFEVGFEKGKFIIKNVLSETIVFEKECVLLKMKNRKNTEKKIDPSHTFTFIPDPLFPKSLEFLEKLILYNQSPKIEYTASQRSVVIHAESLEGNDFLKLVGFLGAYTCILSNEMSKKIGYLKLSEVMDGNFKLPSTFEESTRISLIDPRWNQMRLGLLEISHLASIIEKSQENLEKGIQELDNLRNPHILLQRKRLESQLEKINELYPQYISLKELIISHLKYKIT